MDQEVKEEVQEVSEEVRGVSEEIRGVSEEIRGVRITGIRVQHPIVVKIGEGEVVMVREAVPLLLMVEVKIKIEVAIPHTGVTIRTGPARKHTSTYK